MMKCPVMTCFVMRISAVFLRGVWCKAMQCIVTWSAVQCSPLHTKQSCRLHRKIGSAAHDGMWFHFILQCSVREQITFSDVSAHMYQNAFIAYN